jgi:hypothetical protein
VIRVKVRLNSEEGSRTARVLRRWTVREAMTSPNDISMRKVGRFDTDLLLAIVHAYVYTNNLTLLAEGGEAIVMRCWMGCFDKLNLHSRTLEYLASFKCIRQARNECG